MSCSARARPRARKWTRHRLQMLQAQAEIGRAQREILVASQQQSALYLQAAKDAAATRARLSVWHRPATSRRLRI